MKIKWYDCKVKKNVVKKSKAVLILPCRHQGGEEI
jgi:hypothetical protein